jgi:uncharacterized protein (TIGR03437 family)
VKLRFHLRVWLGLWPALLGGCVALAQAANPVYIGTSYGLYRSADAGATWNYVNVPLNNALLSGNIYVLSLGMDPHDASKIYFIGHATASAFFASADGGQTWSAAPFVGIVPYQMAVDFAGKVIYVTATGAGGSSDRLLYSSTDVGVSWTRLKVPNTTTVPASRYPLGSPVSTFVPDPTVSGTIYALTNGDEFFGSVDFGSSWTQISKPGITLTSDGVVPQTTILGIHLDPKNPHTWYDATDHSSFPNTCPLTNGGLCGLFKSTDGGATFTGLSIPINYVSSVSFGASIGTVYATGDVAGLGSTVMRTSDGGSTWTPLKNGLFSSRSGQIWADPTDGTTLYVNNSGAANSFNVSTDAGAHFTRSIIPDGPPGCIPGACQQQNIHHVLIVPLAAPLPVIGANGVVNGASFQPGIVPNSWVTIQGTNLASLSGDWSNAIVNGKLPTTLNGVSVSMGSKPAYVYYTLPSQLNVLAPDLAPGPATVTVTTAAGTSAPVTATVSQYGPAFFQWPGNQVVATRQDYSYAVKDGTFPGTATVAAKPGDVLVLWATGFGPTNPVAPTGVGVPSDQTYATASAPTVMINNTPAIVFGAALAPGAAGLYQIAIQVPNALTDGDWPIQASIGGAQSPAGTLLSVHH